MRFTAQILFTLFVVVCAVSADGFSQTHLNNATEDLKQFLKANKQIKNGFDRIFYDVYVISTLNPKAKIFSDIQCEQIQDADTAVLQSKELFFYMKLRQLQSKCQLQQPEKVVEKFRNLLKGDSFTNYYYGISGLALLQVKQNFEQACKRLGDFTGPDGTGQLNSKQADSNYLVGGFLLEVLKTCQTTYPQNKFTQVLDDARNGIEGSLGNLVEITTGNFAWLEYSQTVESTLKLVNSIETFFTNKSESLYLKYKNFHFQGIVNFLKEQNNQILTPKQRYMLVEFYKKIETEPFLTLKSGPVVTTKTNTEILFRYENLFGEQVPVATHQLSAQLIYKNEPLIKNLAYKVNEKSDEWNYLFEIPTKEIQEFGYYTVKIAAQTPREVQLNLKVLITTRVKVPEVEFEILEGKGSIPVSFENKVKSGEVLDKLLHANENSQIHFRFKIEFERNQVFQPNLVGIQLKHPTYKFSNNLAFAQFDESKNIYKVVLDLGDTDITLPYNDKYEIELIIADPKLQENVKWSFAKLDINFARQRKDPPPNEADFKLASIIEHTFPAPRSEVPLLFILFFSGLIIAAFLYFLNLLKSLNVNLNQIPNSAEGRLWVGLFFISLIILLLLLLVFWVYINLVKTLYILGALAIPLFLIGNKALTLIKNQDSVQNE